MMRIPFEQLAHSDPEELKNIFDNNGVLHIGSVFDDQVCKEAINSIINQEKELNHSNSVNLVTESINEEVLVKYYQNIYHLSPAFRKFFSKKILDVGKSILGKSDLYFADLEAHIRNPGGGSIPKHQDNFYFNLKKACGFTCYVALSQHDKNTGGLSYKLNSHAKVLNHSASSNPGFSSFLKDKDALNKDNEHIFSQLFYW